MDVFPPELWTEIFALACVDGGRTGRSLALTSRSSNNLSLSVQWQTVAITSPDTLVAFYNGLRTRQREYARVRHLFTSKVQQDPTLHYVLTTLAPYLYTLTLIIPQPNITHCSALAIPFPLLRELTVHGHWNHVTNDPAHVEQDVELQQTFPKLKRLHLLTGPNSVELYADRVPQLTHIRFSSVIGLNLHLCRTLLPTLSQDIDRYAPQVLVDSEEDKDVLSAPLPMLKQIIIQPDPILGRFGHTAASLRRDFAPLLEADKHNRVILMTMGGGTFTQRLQADCSKEERMRWEDRIVGGVGCWKEGLDPEPSTTRRPIPMPTRGAEL